MKVSAPTAPVPESPAPVPPESATDFTKLRNTNEYSLVRQTPNGGKVPRSGPANHDASCDVPIPTTTSKHSARVQSVLKELGITDPKCIQLVEGRFRTDD